MSFKRNDIVSKQRLRDALEEETAMGFAHNDIVTTYAMDKAIAEGGGGGGDYTTAKLTIVSGVEGLTNIAVTGPCIINGELSSGAVFQDISLDIGQSVDVNVLLYNGKSGDIYPIGLAEFTNPSGNITESAEGYVMTGDATVTYTPLE